jgi:hypothetical protein
MKILISHIVIVTAAVILSVDVLLWALVVQNLYLKKPVKKSYLCHVINVGGTDHFMVPITDHFYGNHMLYIW